MNSTEKSYKYYLKDMIFILAERYNDTLNETQNSLKIESNEYKISSSYFYYEVLDLLYQQLIAFQLDDDIKIAEPVLGQKYIPFQE